MKYVKSLPDSLLRRMRETPVPWGPLGYVTYKRTYSRRRPDLGRTEEWSDTVERCLQALLDYGMAVTEEELEETAEHFHQLRIMPAGRGLWQLGTSTVERLGAASLLNCYYKAMKDIESFCFAFDMLMLGGGVGFSVMPNDVFKLPPVKPNVIITRIDRPDVDLIVADNREGWVELLRRVLTAFLVTGRSLTYSCHCVRSKGAPINGFGGIASGPEDLAKGIAQIATILTRRAGKSLRPIDVLDLVNIIEGIVVSGNVRRSAGLAKGYHGDLQFLNAKRWGLGQIPNWRDMSNNTTQADTYEELPEAFWDGYQGDGEPYGLFNLALSRACGRLADGDQYPDPTVEGTNPCGEQSLADGECCDLVEQVLPNIQDRRQMHSAARSVYRIAKAMISLPHHWGFANDILKQNQRIGIGVTGVCQQTRFKADDLDEVYKATREYDKKYSSLTGVRPSVKLTTVKPSGTVSLLPGVTPGVHPAYAQYYIRRIRMASDDPLVPLSRSSGYHVEPVYRFDGTADQNTSVVSFPVATPPGARLARDMSAIDQLTLQRQMQTHWSDNAVSISVYYHKEELPSIRDYLAANYKISVKSVSFLLHQDHGFRQAPYEEITQSQYEELSSKARPIQSLDDVEERTLLDSAECTTGLCPIR
jgi:ribonucleoside-triphosphate reductase